MTAAEIINTYISFFEKQGHTHITNASLVPDNDPTTLFTSSGMQPLVPYLLGEKHSHGTKLVNVQNCFRAQDIEEIGDNRHTTFFRMLGNWSLGDYFKKEQLLWFFEFLTKELKLDPKKLYVTVYASEGTQKLEKDGIIQSLGLDRESIHIWTELFKSVTIQAQFLDLTDIPHTVTQQEIHAAKIFSYGSKKNWWSRSGIPENMPSGEPGGPDSEVFYDFGAELKIHEHSQFEHQLCHVNCECGRFLEIGNSVFMQYKKLPNGNFAELPQKNVDFGGGLERLVAATENKPDMFQTSLFLPIIKTIEKQTEKSYQENAHTMRIITDHFLAAIFIATNNVKPSNKEQGYILRRLIRRGLDHFYVLKQTNIQPILESIVAQYRETDPILTEKFEEIKNTIAEEEQKYANTRKEAKKYIEGKARIIKSTIQTITGTVKPNTIGDELLGQKEISADDAFILYSTHGLSPTQIKSLGYTFNEQTFAEKMKIHKDLSKTASAGKFKGGLADTEELTIKGHTATHLLQQALRDILGDHVSQTGSNITTERLRFDFSHGQKVTDEEIQKVQNIVRKKLGESLPVHFEMLPLQKAKQIGAIGLFDEKYSDKVKVYFIGDYSKEFCGGPHVQNTHDIKSFTITKQENIGHGQRRLYAIVT